MPVIYRPARAVDLQRAGELVVRSMNDLSERHGFGPVATVRPPTFSAFSLSDDPDGLWVAEDADEILGFAFSWVCGDLWFLAQLFVAPGQQGRGIGQELLRRTLEHAQRTNAAIKALITFSFNNVSQGLYVRRGLFPRCLIYNFNVAREVLRSSLQGAHLRCVPLKNTPGQLRILAEIDTRAFGISRAKHHSFLIEDGATMGVMLYGEHDCVGYAYVADGHIGPLAVTQRAALGAAFKDRTGSGGGERFCASVGISSQSVSRGFEHSRRARNAHGKPDGADVDARLWQLDPISAPQSWLHVIANDCYWHRMDLAVTLTKVYLSEQN